MAAPGIAAVNAAAPRLAIKVLEWHVSSYLYPIRKEAESRAKRKSW